MLLYAIALQGNLEKVYDVKKKPDIKGHIRYDSIYTKCPEQVYPKGTADLQMLGEASDAEWLLDWKNYIMGGIQSYFGNRGGGCTIMNLADCKYTRKQLNCSL